MREFKLVNADGLEWDLMRRDAFFHAPDGLGFSKSISTVQVGYNFIETSDSLNQKTPSGEMVFNGYDRYREFIAFISKTPLSLRYKPLDKWYRIQCKVESLGKTELTGAKNLICPISFVALSTWYEHVTVKQNVPEEDSGKVYPYSYSYKYADTTIAVTEIKNGNIESPLIIQIFGPVVNPSWVLSQSKIQLAEGRINVSIPEGNKLVINADPANMEIAEYTILENAFVKDLYAESDFSTARFIFAPPGDSILTIFDESGEDIIAYVEVEKLADSV